MSSVCTTSKRPPKLRAACNECHAAKVRCSGEKSGCQHCANLGLICAFSISRIGKVPGKRSKANRAAAAAAVAAAAAAATSASSSSSSLITTTTAHISPVSTPSEMPSSTRGFPLQSPKANRVTKHTFHPSHVPVTAAPASSVTSMRMNDYYGHLIPLYTSEEGISEPTPFPETTSTPCGLPHTLPADPIGLGISDVGNFCWTTTELEPQPLGPCAVSPSTLVEPPTVEPPLGPPLPPSSLAIARRPSHDWADIDADAATSACDPSGSTSRSSCTTSIRQPATTPEFFGPDGSCTVSGSGPVPIPGLVPTLQSYPYAHVLPGPDTNTAVPATSAPIDSCATYLALLHDIEQALTTHPPQTIDSVLATNQRHLTTLLRLTEQPNFDRPPDDAHLLCTVALSKILTLFNLGYADFTMRMDAHDALGCADRLIRFGVFELNFVEQSAICRSLFLRELKHARLCLGRLVGVWARKSAGSGVAGRLEALLEEMQRRVDFLVAGLESEKV